MKLIPYSHEKVDSSDEIIDIYFQINKKLESIYEVSRLQMFKFCSIFQFGDPKNKKILELGCGSNNSKDNFTHLRNFEPWLLRALKEYGAKPIGIDIGGLEDELFEGYSIDLINDRALDLFPNNSFDIVCAYSFFDSPFLGHHHNPKIIFNKLIPQLERIIKSEGYFIFETTGLIKSFLSKFLYEYSCHSK